MDSCINRASSIDNEKRLVRTDIENFESKHLGRNGGWWRLSEDLHLLMPIEGLQKHIH